MVKLKVYGWQGWRSEADDGHGHMSTREIMAAKSFAAVMRACNTTRRSDFFNFGETGNQAEIDQALSHPGTVFWRPLDDYRNGWKS